MDANAINMAITPQPVTWGSDLKLQQAQPVSGMPAFTSSPTPASLTPTPSERVGGAAGGNKPAGNALTTPSGELFHPIDVGDTSPITASQSQPTTTDRFISDLAEKRPDSLSGILDVYHNAIKSTQKDLQDAERMKKNAWLGDWALLIGNFIGAKSGVPIAPRQPIQAVANQKVEALKNLYNQQSMGMAREISQAALEDYKNRLAAGKLMQDAANASQKQANEDRNFGFKVNRYNTVELPNVQNQMKNRDAGQKLSEDKFAFDKSYKSSEQNRKIAEFAQRLAVMYANNKLGRDRLNNEISYQVKTLGIRESELLSGLQSAFNHATETGTEIIPALQDLIKNKGNDYSDLEQYRRK